jgi:predicted RNase H-like HicB family nuclease
MQQIFDSDLYALVCRMATAVAAGNGSIIGVRQLRGATKARFLAVVTQSGGSFGAFFPDLPGCVATGPSLKVVESRIREALAWHVEGLLEDAEPVPVPVTPKVPTEPSNGSSVVKQWVVSVRVPVQSQRRRRIQGLRGTPRGLPR